MESNEKYLHDYVMILLLISDMKVVFNHVMGGGEGGGGWPVHFRSDIRKVEGGGGGQSTFGTQKIRYR